MKYLLDTNVCIQYLNGRSEIIADKFRNIPSNQIALCSVVKAELFFGAKKSQFSQANFRKLEIFCARFVSYPFDDLAIDSYSSIRDELERKGTPIGGNDLMISAIALSHHLILVTHNTKEFARVTGLELEDWESCHKSA